MGTRLAHHPACWLPSARRGALELRDPLVTTAEAPAFPRLSLFKQAPDQKMEQEKGLRPRVPGTPALPTDSRSKCPAGIEKA